MQMEGSVTWAYKERCSESVGGVSATFAERLAAPNAKGTEIGRLGGGHLVRQFRTDAPVGRGSARTRLSCLSR